MDADSVRRRAAVLGSPIEHSKSPILHNAAFAALGLTDWSYDRIECPAGSLAALVSGLGPEWVGLSVTMPGKVEALEFATERTPRAVAVGSANTLVRTPTGWLADCTDIDGVIGALHELGADDLTGGRCVVVGAGGTARPALVALASLGVTEVALVARDRDRAADTIECGHNAGLDVSFTAFSSMADVAARADVLVSTIPAAAMAPFSEAAAAAPRVLDVIYNPWPTPLATAVQERGGSVVGGLSMLLNQAYGQVELFTGKPAPKAAMMAALAAAD
ncbi:shikimate dehydrogenase [Hoyosella rhizosphaerae]|nr:shikimate dehydrogenase [Hoyosella rhizosphaerae]